jgi:hypothetical protein
MPRKPSPGGKKGDEKKVALVFTAEQTKYRNGINVTAAHSSSNVYNSQSTMRCVTGFSTAIPSLLPTQHSLDNGESHEDERQRPADTTGVPQIPDLKPILIEIHHDREPTVFGTRTVQEDKWQFEELKTADQRQEHDKARHWGDLR